MQKTNSFYSVYYIKISLMFVKLLELVNENHITNVFYKYSTSSVLKNCTTWNLYNSACTID